jgi:hypothetical protein
VALDPVVEEEGAGSAAMVEVVGGFGSVVKKNVHRSGVPYPLPNDVPTGTHSRGHAPFQIGT